MSKIVIAGDLFPTSSNCNLFAKGDIDTIFGEKIIELFKKADYSICNLEGVLCQEGIRAIKKDGPKIRADINTIKGIAALGIDNVSLANNHSTDFGLEGFKQTCRALTENGIAFFGAGLNEESIQSYSSLRIGGRSVILYGVSETIFNCPGTTKPGANIYDEHRVCEELKLLKRENNILIVLYHGGMEYFQYPTKTIRRRFHRMVDAGADVVLAQHTHCIVAEEYYHSSYLLYGQGNFCFNFSSSINQLNKYGLIIELDISDNGITILKHVVRRTSNGTIYDNEQNLVEFTERSRKVAEGSNFQEEFDRYVDEKIIGYLQAFRGKNIVDRLVKRIFGNKYYKKYILQQYNQSQLLKILNALRADEFGEISTRGIELLIDKYY